MSTVTGLQGWHARVLSPLITREMRLELKA